VLDAQPTQLLDVAEQLAIDVVFDFRHFGTCPNGAIGGGRQGRKA
jgi:hypothetical protein